MAEFLKSMLAVLNELLTLGGASALKSSLERYRKNHEVYREIYSKIESCQKQIEINVLLIGVSLIKARRTLVHAEHMLNKKFEMEESVRSRPDPKLFHEIHRFKHNLKKSLSDNKFLSLVGFGAGTATGGALSVGSWAVVASLGSASTGAAISGLSGIAAGNATLAWFGGGALAAGGAGMAGGSVVLAVVALLPVVGISTWWAYRQAKKFDEKTEVLSAEIEKCNAALVTSMDATVAIDRNRQMIEVFCGEFESNSLPLFAVVRPMGVFSRCKQAYLRMIGRRSMNSGQIEALEQIGSHVGLFLKRLETFKIN